jgi:hypothetical protein
MRMARPRLGSLRVVEGLARKGGANMTTKSQTFSDNGESFLSLFGKPFFEEREI